MKEEEFKELYADEKNEDSFIEDCQLDTGGLCLKSLKILCNTKFDMVAITSLLPQEEKLELKKQSKRLFIGVPKEIAFQESRIAIVPTKMASINPNIGPFPSNNVIKSLYFKEDSNLPF
ncbi:hypothetical protein N9Y89_00130 [bacterium]|nr:hypothetical protein [bacterium]